jgi:hypothetical protein
VDFSPYSAGRGAASSECFQAHAGRAKASEPQNRFLCSSAFLERLPATTWVPAVNRFPCKWHGCLLSTTDKTVKLDRAVTFCNFHAGCMYGISRTVARHEWRRRYRPCRVLKASVAAQPATAMMAIPGTAWPCKRNEQTLRQDLFISVYFSIRATWQNFTRRMDQTQSIRRLV